MKAIGPALLALALAVTARSASLGDEVATPAEDRRGIEQTFLTFPEWFLVFSPAEYADFVAHDAPHDFVFWSHIGQFWRSYAAVTREIAARDYPPNPGYHVMILVIGVSTTVEYALRSAYETTLGRLSSLAVGGARTPEDDFGARAAREYVDFIRVRPWYEFDFAARLAVLWRDVPALGPHLLRKWERRYALTSEYAVKAAYGWLIENATHSAYEAPSPVTAAWVDRWPACSDAGPVSDVKPQADGSAIVLLPRYQAFTQRSLAIARCGAGFREIAGNRAAILVSVVAPIGDPPAAGARVLFEQPILTRPGQARRAYIVPVAGLSALLRETSSQGATVEHIFDY
jgi:hypothetical protein